MEPYDRIEFGFVFLCHSDQMHALKNFSTLIHDELRSLRIKGDIPKIWGSYVNKPLMYPHLSVGQYGMLSVEIPVLMEMVEDIASHTSVTNLDMKESLSVLEDYIFFDAKNCFKDVDNRIKDTYIKLRSHFFSLIKTRFPITQAYLSKIQYQDNNDELELINRHFQNWMIPENNRMRPHFTMYYHPRFMISDIKKKLSGNLEINNYLKKLKTISLTHLGVIKIDIFGNPVKSKPLFMFNLK